MICVDTAAFKFLGFASDSMIVSIDSFFQRKGVYIPLLFCSVLSFNPNEAAIQHTDEYHKRHFWRFMRSTTDRCIVILMPDF